MDEFVLRPNGAPDVIRVFLPGQGQRDTEYYLGNVVTEVDGSIPVCRIACATPEPMRLGEACVWLRDHDHETLVAPLRRPF